MQSLISDLILIIIVTICVSGRNAYNSEDYDSLGSRISYQVNRDLRPLHNLGSRISDEVNRNLSPLQNLGSRIQDSLSPLDNLGATIQQSVYESLEPVRQFESIANLKNGLSGPTVAKFKPNGKRLVIQNGRRYECLGEISYDSGECKGKLQDFEINTDDDYCYADSKVNINNHICFTSGSGVSISSVNGQISCKSSDGTPGKLLSAKEYLDQCKNLADSVQYTYFPDKDAPLDKNLKCSTQTGRPICSYEETSRLTLNNGGIQFSGNVYNY